MSDVEKMEQAFDKEARQALVGIQGKITMDEYELLLIAVDLQLRRAFAAGERRATRSKKV